MKVLESSPEGVVSCVTYGNTIMVQKIGPGGGWYPVSPTVIPLWCCITIMVRARYRGGGILCDLRYEIRIVCFQIWGTRDRRYLMYTTDALVTLKHSSSLAPN